VQIGNDDSANEVFIVLRVQVVMEHEDYECCCLNISTISEMGDGVYQCSLDYWTKPCRAYKMINLTMLLFLLRTLT